MLQLSRITLVLLVSLLCIQSTLAEFSIDGAGNNTFIFRDSAFVNDKLSIFGDGLVFNDGDNEISLATNGDGEIELLGADLETTGNLNVESIRFSDDTVQTTAIQADTTCGWEGRLCTCKANGGSRDHTIIFEVECRNGAIESFGYPFVTNRFGSCTTASVQNILNTCDEVRL